MKRSIRSKFHRAHFTIQRKSSLGVYAISIWNFGKRSFAAAAPMPLDNISLNIKRFTSVGILRHVLRVIYSNLLFLVIVRIYVLTCVNIVCYYFMLCTGLFKSNWPLHVSVSHKQGNRLSDLKFLRCIAHIINVLLTKFKIRTMSHIATMGLWTNALFGVQIQVCQLVVEPRNLAGCVIYVGHASSISCFYH